MGKVIYLDNNATSQCAPEVLVGMLPFFSSQYANPASSHILGRNVAQHIHKAKCQVAASLHCDPSEVIFTSGATESNNLALLGLTRAPVPTRRRVLVAATEHKSVFGAKRIFGRPDLRSSEFLSIVTVSFAWTFCARQLELTF